MPLPVAFLAAASAGLQLFQGLQGRDDAKAALITEKGNAAAANIIRKAQNQVEAASASLGRYVQSRQNQERLKAGGKAVDATTQNIGRLQESALVGSIGRRVQAAEEAGALVARQGALGVRGSTADMLRVTQDLRVAQIEDAALRTQAQQEEGLREQQRSALDASILGLDLSPIIGSINVMEQQARQIRVPSLLEVGANAALAFAQTYSKLKAGGNPASAGVNLQGQDSALSNNPAFVRNM